MHIVVDGARSEGQHAARRAGLYGFANIGGEGGQETGESGDDRRYI